MKFAATFAVIDLTRGELARNYASVETPFVNEKPLIPGDRVQLQQVVST
jgi:hypothetical protein